MKYRIDYTTDIPREVHEIRASFINSYSGIPYTTDDINSAYVYRQWLEQNGGKTGKYFVKEFTS